MFTMKGFFFQGATNGLGIEVQLSGDSLFGVFFYEEQMTYKPPPPCFDIHAMTSWIFLRYARDFWRCRRIRSSGERGLTGWGGKDSA